MGALKLAEARPASQAFRDEYISLVPRTNSRPAIPRGSSARLTPEPAVPSGSTALLSQKSPVPSGSSALLTQEPAFLSGWTAFLTHQPASGTDAPLGNTWEATKRYGKLCDPKTKAVEGVSRRIQVVPRRHCPLLCRPMSKLRLTGLTLALLLTFGCGGDADVGEECDNDEDCKEGLECVSTKGKSTCQEPGDHF